MMLYIFLFSLIIKAEIRIGIIDSGFSSYMVNKVKLCNEQVLNTSTSTTTNDLIGHGNYVLERIREAAKDIKTCYVLVKYLNDNGNSTESYIKALKIMLEQKVDVLNLSISGGGFIGQEENLITRIIQQKTIIVASSGNDGVNLDTSCNRYPACYDEKIIVVGTTDYRGNYGKVVDYYGLSRTYICNPSGCGFSFGTSFATATQTGNVVLNYKKYKKEIYGE